MEIFLISLGKLIIRFSKLLNLGNGSTWPGHIAMEANPNFVKNVINSNPGLKTIVIAGTNGKTTTTKLLGHIFKKENKKVFSNESGANLLNGIASSIIQNSNAFGKLPFDVALFEVDENNLPMVLKEIEPDVLILLNLFRDQLDRYGEVNTIAEKWKKAIQNLSDKTLIIANGDDPQLTYISQLSQNKTVFFGLDKKEMKKDKITNDADFLFCPNCKQRLKFGSLVFSHLGDYKCAGCGFVHPKTETFDKFENPLFGVYNKYNLNAALLVSELLLNKTPEENVLSEFDAAFGRQEVLEYENKQVVMLLSKNPTGLNQSINAVLEKASEKDSILIALNDSIPDGRDVSWIWDADFELLSKFQNITITGDRAYDMGIRMRHATGQIEEVIPDFKDAIDKACRKTAGKVYVLPTYSAMLELRKVITGRKIL